MGVRKRCPVEDGHFISVQRHHILIEAVGADPDEFFNGRQQRKRLCGSFPNITPVGAEIIAKDQPLQNAALYNPRNSESAYAVFVTDNGKVTFSDATVKSEHGSAVRVENGVVRLETGLIFGEQRGVYMTSGSLQVKYGKVIGYKKYGIEVGAPASEPVPTSITVSDGEVSGMSGPILARSEGTAK